MAFLLSREDMRRLKENKRWIEGIFFTLSLWNHLVLVKAGFLNSVKEPVRLAELIDSPVPLVVLMKRQILARRNENDVDLSRAKDEVSFFSWPSSSPTIVADVSDFFLHSIY